MRLDEWLAVTGGIVILVFWMRFIYLTRADRPIPDLELVGLGIGYGIQIAAIWVYWATI